MSMRPLTEAGGSVAGFSQEGRRDEKGSQRWAELLPYEECRPSAKLRRGAAFHDPLSGFRLLAEIFDYVLK